MSYLLNLRVTSWLFLLFEFDLVRLMTSYTILTEELFEFFPEEADMSDP